MWQSSMELNRWVCSVSVVKLLRVTKLTVSVLSDIDWLCVYMCDYMSICNSHLKHLLHIIFCNMCTISPREANEFQVKFISRKTSESLKGE